MKILLKLEHAGILVLAIYLLLNINSNLLLLAVLFLSPDLFMFGYLINPKIGAFTYNLAHHLGLGALILISGYILKVDVVSYLGGIMLAHSSFDRILGYGLKLPSGFRDTHLGRIGEKNF